LFYIHSIKLSQDASEVFLLNMTDAPSQASVDVDPVETANILESTCVVNVPDGTKHARDAKRRRLVEEIDSRVIEERMEKVYLTEEQAKELQRLRDFEKFVLAEEQAKELQRLRDLEKAWLAQLSERDRQAGQKQKKKEVKVPAHRGISPNVTPPPVPHAAMSIGTINNSGNSTISGFNVTNNHGKKTTESELNFHKMSNALADHP
jgi:hypothetical protein